MEVLSFFHLNSVDFFAQAHMYPISDTCKCQDDPTFSDFTL